VRRSCQALKVSIISVSLPHWYFFSLHSNTRGLVVSNYSRRRFPKCPSSYLRRMERLVAVRYEVTWEVCRNEMWVGAACRFSRPIVLCVGVSLVSNFFVTLVLPRWHVGLLSLLDRERPVRSRFCASLILSHVGGCACRWVYLSVGVFSVDVSFSACIPRSVCL